MTKLKHIPVLLASCLLLGGFTTDVSAQDRNWDRDRDLRERNRDRDRDRDDRDRMRGRDDNNDEDRNRRARERDRDDDNDDRERRARGRDRDEDRDRHSPGRERWWGDYDRGRNCYTVRRRFIDRDGDVVVRRSRVCED